MVLMPFFVWQNKVLKKIDPLQVACLKTVKNYTDIILADGTKYSVRSSLAGALKKLPPDIFIRIHRSVIVSIFYIDDITRDHLMLGDLSVPISREYRKSTFKMLNIIE
jgi:two-component system LytT family response regulator